MSVHNRKLIIAIDFDDTITEPSPFPITGRVRPEAIKVIKKLQEKYICCLWTCRAGDYLTQAINILASHGITFDYVNCSPKSTGSPKIVADYYIDDRAFGSAINWREIEHFFL